MRTVLTISMSPKLKKKVDTIVKEYHYSSTSEFLRDAIRIWEEDQLYRSIMRSKKEFAEGKGKKLRSLQDLL